ncbi:MAG TPA: MFS transporter [Negativicutes bacterium]|jgi:MFS family permease
MGKNERVRKINKFVLKAAVLSISLLLMGAGAVSPALATMMEAFPNANPSTVMLIMTLPSMTMVIFSLIYGKIAHSLKRKTGFYISMLFFLVGGIGPVLVNDLTTVLVMRAIFGISLGLLNPLATILVADFFAGTERESMMGMQSAFVNIGGIFWQLLGGILCAINWHYTFLSYFLGAAVLLVVFFFLPEPEKIQSSSVGDGQASGLSWKVYIVEFSLFVYNLLLFVFITNVAVEIVGDKLGNSTSVGLALTVFTVGGLLTGLMFGKIIGVFTRFTIAVGWIVTGIGFAFIANVHDFNLLIAGCFIAGIGFATTMPASFVRMSYLAQPAAIPLAFGLSYAFMGVGQFLSPLVVEIVANFFGHGPGRFPILISGYMIAVIGAIILINNLQVLKSTDVSSGS